MKRILIAPLVCLCLASTAFAEDKILPLNDFENDADLKSLQSKGPVQLTDQHVSHGKNALDVTWDAKTGGTYVDVSKPPADWSAYDALQIDVFNPGETLVPGEVVVCDKAWNEKKTFWNRHNGTRMFGTGRTTWTIPVSGLYRGDTAFRNRDIARNIDPDSIVRLYFGFGAKGVEGKVIIDNLRLVKIDRPQGIWAFDVGPKSQAVMLGWTPVSPDIRYEQARGHGFTGAVPPNAARDAAFGPSLIRDAVDFCGVPFRVDVPEGEYDVLVIFENSGFWGGEQARHTRRSIEVDGKALWSEERPDGAAHALHRFEQTEPLGDLWNTYMAPELARPITFKVTAGKQGLAFKINSDAPSSARVSTLVLHKSDNTQAAKWLAGQLDSVASEFRQMTPCLDKPAAPFQAGEPWQKLGLVAWPVNIDDIVKPTSTPPAGTADPHKIELTRLSLRNETESFCIAVRPLKDLGECRLQLSFDEPAMTGIDTEIGVAWYGLWRQTGGGSLAYRIEPRTLRTQSTVTLQKDITRELIVTCRVSDRAPVGKQKLTLVLTDAGGNDLLRIPLHLDVRAAKLDRQTDFVMGFYGMAPLSLSPKAQHPALLQQSLRILQQHAMNGISGAANFTLRGFKDGQPDIDFADMDAFVKLAKSYGFTKAIDNYSGGRLVGINDGYQIGATGKKLAEQAGLPYEEVLMRTWKAVDEHARKADWPLIHYVLCDETRVVEECQRELEFMTLMSKVSKAYPRTLRTGGAYSVDFKTRPDDPKDVTFWLQKYFHTLDVSTLNLHDETVLAEAKKLGKELRIYNQGLNRYSFGIYQWSEFQKGVTARWQWHLNDLYGYQFCDLDGWYFDEMMIYYGRNTIYPTVALARCRDGAEDFYLYQMLWNRIQKGSGTDAARTRARALLEGVTSKIKVNQREGLEGFDADAFKLQVIAALEELQ